MSSPLVSLKSRSRKFIFGVDFGFPMATFLFRGGLIGKSKTAIRQGVIVLISSTLISIFSPAALSAPTYYVAGIVHPVGNGVGSEYRTFSDQVTAYSDYADIVGTNGQLAISKYYANLATGRIGAYSYARSDYDRYAYSASAGTNVSMQDTLNFHVPAGTYPDGLTVTLHGSIGGFFSASGQAQERGHFQAIFGSGPSGNYDLDVYRDFGTYNVAISDNFALTATILTPSLNPRPALTVSQAFTLTLSAGEPLGAVALRTTDYGEAIADFYDTLRFSSVDVPAGVTWDSASGVFLTQAAVPEPEAYAMLLAGLGLLGFVARRRKQNAA